MVGTMQLSRNWWSVALRALAAVIFGVVALVAPGLSLVALVLVFGAYAFVDGLFAIAAGFGTPAGDGLCWPKSPSGRTAPLRNDGAMNDRYAYIAHGRIRILWVNVSPIPTPLCACCSCMLIR